MLEGKPCGLRLVTAERGRDSIQRFAEERTRARDIHALEARALGTKDTAVLQVDPRLVQEQPLQPCLVKPKPASATLPPPCRLPRRQPRQTRLCPAARCSGAFSRTWREDRRLG